MGPIVLVKPNGKCFHKETDSLNFGSTGLRLGRPWRLQGDIGMEIRYCIAQDDLN